MWKITLPGWRHRLLIMLALVLPWLYFVKTARMFVDYGDHWDEWYSGFILKENIDNLAMLPSTYFYGTWYAFPARLALLPEAIPAFHTIKAEASQQRQKILDVQKLPNSLSTSAKLKEIIDSNGFKLRTRQIYILLTSFAIFAVYFAAAATFQSPLAGVCAAWSIAFSWEINSYARHIAVDTLQMLFVPIFLAVLFRKYKRSFHKINRASLFQASIIAGLAGGTKYTGIILIVACLTAIWLLTPGRKWSRRLQWTVLSLTCCFLTFFIINPGILLDPIRFLHSASYGLWDYSRIRWPYPHTVRSSFEHARLAIVYISGVSLSPFLSLAAGLSAISLFGVYRSFQKSARLTCVLLSFPVLYFLSVVQTHLLIARNLLPLIPFLCIFLGLGGASLYELTGNRKMARTALCAMAAIWLCLNGWWMYSSASTGIYKEDTTYPLHQLQTYLAEHRSTSIYLSKALRRDMAAAGVTIPDDAGVVDDIEMADYICLYKKEQPAQNWQANRPGRYRVFGTQEVNFDYSPAWYGRNHQNRIFLVSLNAAKKMDFNLGAL